MTIAQRINLTVSWCMSRLMRNRGRVLPPTFPTAAATKPDEAVKATQAPQEPERVSAWLATDPPTKRFFAIGRKTTPSPKPTQDPA